MVWKLNMEPQEFQVSTLKNSQKILTFSKNFSHFPEGMQGQVERLNGTLKLATTKALLQALHIGAEGGSSFEEQLSTQQRWVEAMKQQVEIYNHTPKNLTKVSPIVAHFPERFGKIDKFNVVNEAHIALLNEVNAQVREGKYLLLVQLILILNSRCLSQVVREWCRVLLRSRREMQRSTLKRVK